MNKILCCVVLALPLHHLSVTSGFGPRIHPVMQLVAFHAGVDLRADHDTVYAMTNGRVKAGYSPLLGNYIRIGAGDLEFVYGHLSQLFVLTGDSVAVDQPVAISGSTGRVTGPHLHFAVRYRGNYIDPLKFFLYAMQQFNNQ